MADRTPYSRVYWSIVDDPKFAAIYDDDRHLAAWLRLLLIADQAHPASGHIPTTARRASVRALSDCGLVNVEGGRFRIHGLDAERLRRSEPARQSANARWSHSERSPSALPTQSERNAPAMLGRDETRRDEQYARERAASRDDDLQRRLERTRRETGELRTVLEAEKPKAVS